MTPSVYVMTNRRNGTLYTGVTSNLVQRIYQHRETITEGFTCQYRCTRLAYYELHATMESAIIREKQIKTWRRKKKIDLIESLNPLWDDLYDRL